MRPTASRPWPPSSTDGRVGVEIEDGLRITPETAARRAFRSYHDHRMATAGAVLALRIRGVTVEDIGTTAKTLPDFTGLWTAMLGGHAGRS